jgi:two-component system LytT family response regulator
MFKLRHMTVYLLEDEINILRHMISLIREIPYLQMVGYSNTVEKAALEIDELQPELILADIALLDGSSFEVFTGKEIRSHIIFITAHEQFAIDALNLGAFAYLLKPIDKKVLFAAVEKCFRQREEYRFSRQQLELSAGYFSERRPTGMLALKSLSHTQIVRTSDIMYCHSDNGYTTFFIIGEKPLMVSKVIREYEPLLPSGQFLRCHQSYLVNVAFIKRYYAEGFIEMSDGTTIPVSARKKALVRDFFDHIA